MQCLITSNTMFSWLGWNCVTDQAYCRNAQRYT